MKRSINLLLALLALWILPGLSEAGHRIVYYHTDALGSVVAATDEHGDVLWRESYKPFGERQKREVGTEQNTPFYTGKPHDDITGLSYFGARYYDPEIGRFMGIDPVGVDPGNIHSFNRYAYANNNPYKYVDPDGRDPSLAMGWQIYIENVTAPELGVDPYTLEGAKIIGQHYQREGLYDAGGSLVGGVIGKGTGQLLGKLMARVTNGSLRQFGRSVDDLSSAANQAINKEGLTAAARALTKHASGQRGTGTFPQLRGGVGEQNKAAQQIVDDILGNSNSSFTNLSRGGLEVRAPDGRGIRFNSDGKLSGFLDPRK